MLPHSPMDGAETKQTLDLIADFDAATACVKLPELIHSALQFIRQRLGFERVSISLHVEGGFELVDVESKFTGVGTGAFIPSSDTVLTSVLQGDAPVYRPDIAAWQPRYKVDDFLIHHGIFADYLVPLVTGGIRIGTFNCGATFVDGIGSGARTALLYLIPRLANALNLSLQYSRLERSEEQLAASKKLFETVIDAAPT